MRDMLDHFRICVDDKKYTERIPYDIWREIKKSDNKWRIKFLSPSNVYIYKDGSTIPCFSAKIYECGFGRFFWDNVIMKENDSMAIINTLLSAGTCSESTCSSCSTSTANDLTWHYDTKTNIDATKVASKPYSTNTVELNIPSLNNFDYYKYEDAWISTISKSEMEERLDKLEAELQNKVDKRKENDKMKGFNFDFGPVKDIVHMSMYGMAIKNKSGNYVSYDTATESIIDVDILNFEGANKFMYKMPVPIADIKVGDIVVHNGIPCFVRHVPDCNVKTFEVIDPYEGEMKEILIPKSMFGFDYTTKVVNLLEGMFGNITASAENPFGNMLPLMLLNDGVKSDDMLPMMLMMSQNISGTNMFSNPMMMYMMMKDRKDFDPMMLMLMMNQPAPTHECKCKHSEK